MQPQLLLLDEVTSALDPELVAEVLDVIRELAAGGMTMLIATHEMGFARDVAHRVCFLHEGRILEQGPPEQLFGEPREERTRQFLQRIVAAGAERVGVDRTEPAQPVSDFSRTPAALDPRDIVSTMVQDPHRLDVSLEPLDEYLVIQPVSDETETRAGLILPASARPLSPAARGS